MANKSSFINRYRQQVGELVAAIDRLRALRREYDVLNYDTGLVDGDFTGDNADLVAQQFHDGVGSIAALDNLLETQPTHAANLYRLKRG